MAVITPFEAIGAALTEEMRRDPRVLIFGEGVATKRHDLLDEFGPARVRDTPLAEGIIAGTAVGAAATGLRPVIDLLFAPFLCYAMDELVNSAGKLRFISGGQFAFPMVTLAMGGGGWGVGAQHNHNNEAWFVHSPGPFFIDLGLLYQAGEVPEGEHLLPLGKASVLRTGSDVTLVSYGKTVHACLAAAQQLAEAAISAEVIDLRSLKPLDEEAIMASVHKTGRLVVAHEAAKMAGVGAEIAAQVAERAFADLRAPIIRLGGPDAPAAASHPLEQAYAPSAEAICAAAKSICP